MTLRVRGSDSFQAVVLRALQCLDLRITYMGADRRGIIESAVVIDPTMVGMGHAGRVRTRALLGALMQSGYPVRIEETGGGSECVPPRGYTGRTGSTVLWNPGQTLAHAPACRCIYLGHELCHAYQLIRGYLHPSERFGGLPAKMRYEMLTITGQYGRDQAEPDAVTENDLRREHIPPQPLRRSL